MSRKNTKKGRSAKILRYDSDLDLALLEVKRIKTVPSIGLADSDQVMVGDPSLQSGTLKAVDSGPLLLEELDRLLKTSQESRVSMSFRQRPL